MKEKNWREYQNALLSTLPPYSEMLYGVSDTDLSEVKKYLNRRKLFFARWTSNFDCGYPTQWWWCIKDTPINLEKLTAKQRYRINKGLKNCVIKQVSREDVFDVSDDIHSVLIAALNEYPAKYRVIGLKEDFINYITTTQNEIWCCWDKESGILCAYAECGIKEDIVDLAVVKVIPAFKNKEVNVAIAYEICKYYLNEKNVRYISDGERNIRHETNYQDFLIKTLDFRYAYCNLNIVYNSRLAFIIRFLYPFRKLVKLLSEYNKLIYNVYCVLRQEEIRRTFK